MLPVRLGPAGFEGFISRKAKGSLTPKAAEDDLGLRWSLPCRSGTYVLGMVFHLGDQPLNGFAAPTLQATTQRTQMGTTIASRIARLEFGEEFDGRLIRTRFQALNHLRPVSDKTLETKTKSTWLFNEAAIFGSPNYNTPSTCIPTP
jgi:hypothetical protein